MTTPRTLKDYRPQCDEDCESRKCGNCAHPWPHRGLGRTCEIATAECRTTGEQELCGCVFTPKPCSCGLDALLLSERGAGETLTVDDWDQIEDGLSASVNESAGQAEVNRAKAVLRKVQKLRAKAAQETTP